MATANHHLQQQRPIVEARIRTLVNNDLKEICRAHNYQVSGNKAHLQARCIESEMYADNGVVLRKIINDNNQTAFDALSYQISHHGQEPPPSFSHVKTADTGFSSPTTASYSHTHHSRPLPAQGRSALGRLPPPGRLFKPSPFYEIIDNVLPFDYLPEYPQNRNTVNATLRLKEDAVRRLAGDSTLRLLLYCGIDTNLAPNSPPIDISFPSQIEVKINGDDVRSNFKGLKNKPGSTKPADVTDKVRRNTGYGNMIAITYALTTKQYIFGIQLARYCNATTLTERIKQGRFIPKQTVLDEMSKANSDPDIATTSVRMSLKDPISTLRITVPIRSDRCAHNQCFDGSMFMQLQEQAPQWLCPICNRTILFESLRVDKYFEDILNRTPKSTEKVDIEPNGEWHVIDTGDNARDNPPRGPRAAYDDDFDDEDDDVEIVEIKDEPPSATLSNGSFARSMALPAISQMTTPPVSSREASIAQQNTQGTKRPATVMPTVIDLISSDEDEPVRPAKR
ncbi:uncharacterized protein K489DRAFT_319371, partial [Dissoconium aciculare CBS 342.82]|uniref:Zf-MIZ-domain-containing protein n=1 Tax=Dissoconium aciculare CBS 342.82 TaxID=1314786 RepID=A0A6J3M3M4_9PEZI